MTGATDTIAAIATPPGSGGIGIIRISGPKAEIICQKLCNLLPKPRFATVAVFRDAAGRELDHGLVLRFPAPHSFTGECVIELQGHGGRIVSQMVLHAALDAGARLARAGEFSERAFLNDRMDLAQAEAVADLIESGSQSAARLALRSLRGEFSRAVEHCADAVEELRMYVEAAIDFPEEEIDFLNSEHLEQKIKQARSAIDTLLLQCSKGAVIRNSLQVVICGLPNAGKSSLLNVLAGKSRAIVSDIPGTTRDTIDTEIQIGGMHLNLVDTAGIRDQVDRIEQEGIQRSLEAVDDADLLLLVHDDQDPASLKELTAQLPWSEQQTSVVIHNKIDLSGNPARSEAQEQTHIWLSARTGDGIALLEQYLSDFALNQAGDETMYLARARHVEQLQKAQQHLLSAIEQFDLGNGELVAEELWICHRELGEITGQTTSDDLLGKIFGSFCIGK